MTEIRIEERRNAPAIPISDDSSSSSSSSDSSASLPILMVQQPVNQIVVDLPMHSVARAWNSLLHLLQQA